MLATLSVPEIALLAAAASLVGISKTALPGAGTITVAVFAAVLPARESTGVLLVLLVLGDLFAVRMYHAHADWRVLRRMVPAVLVGVAGGTVFLALADDVAVRRVIALILLALVAVTLARRSAGARAAAPAPDAGPGAGGDPAAAPGTPVAVPGSPADARADARADSDARAHADAARPAWRRQLDTGVYGTLAGFTTMVANAGGPVMSMYLLAARFPVKQFLGTAAWFFLVVNLGKVPFSVGLGLISVPSLVLDLVLAPAVVLGALLGRRMARRIDQALFERVVIVFTVVSAGYLLVQPG